MSESVSKPNIEPIDHLFGLFGSDPTADVVRDGSEEVEASDGLIQTDLMDGKVDEIHCIICKSIEIKYRCPKCQLKTCSLSCCRRHKTKYNCNGLRDKTCFVKVSDFTQNQFLSDYFFLEDVDQTLDSSSRERRSIISSKNVLPKWIQTLVRECRRRGTYLKIMPAGFKRRKQNTTCFMYSQCIIKWDIELTFVHALDPKDKHIETEDHLLVDDLIVSHSPLAVVERRVSETTKLLDLLSKYIETNDLIENYIQNQRLSLYRKCGITGIGVLFCTQTRGSNYRKYIEMDLNKSIRDNMSGQTVIEFPTFLVILNQMRHSFDIKSEESHKRFKSE